MRFDFHVVDHWSRILLTLVFLSVSLRARSGDVSVEGVCNGNATTEISTHSPQPTWSHLDQESYMTACRQDPTWTTVDAALCQQLMGWNPRDHYWKHDHETMVKWLGERGAIIEECLQAEFGRARELFQWARCSRNSTSKICMIQKSQSRGHYFRGEEENEGDELLIYSDAFTEHEAFGVEALERCTRSAFDHNETVYEAREFGDDTMAPTHGMYNEEGGNYCTFLNGLLQLYLPGVAASTFHVVQKAYNEHWGERRSLPSPSLLGVHSAEFLRYGTSGKLGIHQDDDTVYSISVALSNYNDYDGGYFRLQTKEAFFKVPRRSAIIFFGESLHGITDIVRGERKVFVMELWDNDDVPVGYPRPDMESFEDHKIHHANILHRSASAPHTVD